MPVEGVTLVTMRRFARTTFTVLLLLSLSICSSCSRKPVTLTQEEERLAEQAGFEQDVVLLVKQKGEGELRPLEDREDKAWGIEVSSPERRTAEAIRDLQADLQPRGYLVFRAEMNFGFEPDKIGVIKGTDQYDILRVRQTDGINYDITNEQVIAKLQEWEKRYPLRIVGADHDWVHAEFESVPEDMLAFAREVYEFCPDVVEQGPGSVEALAMEMQDERDLFLWWD